VNFRDGIWHREVENVVVAAQVHLTVRKALPAVVLFLQLELLNHGAHGTINHHDSLRQLRPQVRFQVRLTTHIRRDIFTHFATASFHLVG